MEHGAAAGAMACAIPLLTGARRRQLFFDVFTMKLLISC